MKFSVLVHVLFVNLTYTTVFDMHADGMSHTFPIKHGMKCFFESCMYRVLQIVVVPTDCMVLKSSGDDDFPSLYKTSVSSTN